MFLKPEDEYFFIKKISKLIDKLLESSYLNDEDGATARDLYEEVQNLRYETFAHGPYHTERRETHTHDDLTRSFNKALDLRKRHLLDLQEENNTALKNLKNSKKDYYHSVVLAESNKDKRSKLGKDFLSLFSEKEKTPKSLKETLTKHITLLGLLKKMYNQDRHILQPLGVAVKMGVSELISDNKQALEIVKTGFSNSSSDPQLFMIMFLASAWVTCPT